MPFGPPDFVGVVPTSSLVALWRSMQSYFTAQLVPAQVYLGLKYRDLWDTSRVVIIDGEFSGSNTPAVRNAGKLGAPWQKQSYNPRELAAWERPITLSIRGVDSTNVDSEEAQTQATEALLEATIQGLQNAMAIDDAGNPVSIGQNNIDWAGSKMAWVDPGTATQQTWGKELLLAFTYKCVIFDLPDFVQQVTFDLQKGPLLNSLKSGQNASVASASVASGTAVLRNLSVVQASWVGMSITLSGASSSGNNGTFPVSAILSPTSIVIANASARAPDVNNGSISWQIGPA